MFGVFLILMSISAVTSYQNSTCNCLETTSGLGLDGGLQVVLDTTFECHNRTDCLDKLCKINANPSVAWITFRVSCGESD